MVPLRPEDVRDRLGYARVRINELLALNRGDLPGADAHARQRLTQEVFFHLVGAIEVFAQLVNEQRNLGVASEDVSIGRVNLPAGDPLGPLVAALYANPKREPLPPDPYAADGLMYRIWNYRHQVTHRRANPFQMHLTLGARTPRRAIWFTTAARHGLQRSTPAPDRSGHFLLDPRSPPGTASDRPVQQELEAMYELVKERLDAAIGAL